MHQRQVRDLPAILLTLLITLLPAPVLAWHETGHRKTATIAWEQLTVDEQDRIAIIIRAHPRFREDFADLLPHNVDAAAADSWYFTQAAVWPDHIQDLGDDVRAEYHRSRWHYINVPVYLEETDRERLAGRLDHNMVLEFTPPLRQNLNVIQALQGNLGVWHDATATDADKAVALCWILHLTGDLHQPLHTVALFSSAYFPRGDRGGNEIPVAWDARTRNLHSVWDGLPTDMRTFDASAATHARLGAERVADAKIDNWLWRHAGLARDHVYTKALRVDLLRGLRESELRELELDNNYLTNARSIAQQQVVLAGYRLAALLQAR